MSLIVLEQGSLSFGGQEIFSSLNVRVGEQERIGVVGPNGSGKSTLLKVLCGRQGMDGGQVRFSRQCRIGYLPQDILELGGETLLSSVMDTVPGRIDIETQLAQTEIALTETEEPEAQLRLAQNLATMHEKLERFETYFSEQRAMIILVGLGFRHSDFHRPTSEFSGGWKMRAALAGLLFQDPDVLFLDEPTNHLDVPSVAWLDGYLKECKNSLMLICHDREFLNRHIERVISFEPEGVRFYKGNYDDYQVQRAQEEEILEASARNREREIKELERFVERFRAKATKARQAQSRAKQIEKIEKEIKRPIPRPKQMRFTFPPTPRSGRDVVLLEGISKSFGSNVIYRNLTQGAYTGDRIAIIGINGVGKTTLLKIMAGELAPDSGGIRLGSGVEMGYYAQHHTELLDPKCSVLEEVWKMNPGTSQSYVRGVCGAFLFSGNDVEKAVGILSGGERARVLLARLLVKPTNLLLMDEPTNHLDVASAEALADALHTFDGTLIFVSHNRSFINHLATKIWDIAEGQVIEYPGNLNDYFHHQAIQKQQESAIPLADVAEAQGHSSAGKVVFEATNDQELIQQRETGAKNLSREEQKERKRREAELRNDLSRRTRKIREEIAFLEERIAKLEVEQREIEPQMADPTFYKQTEAFKVAIRQYQDNRAKIEELYARWEYQQEQLEELMAKG